MKMEIDLCLAAGINIRNMEPIDVYLTACKILDDVELRKAAEKYLKGAILPMGTSAFVMNSWPEAKRIALRERVAGVVQFRGAKR
jgi:hypothetical protein